MAKQILGKVQGPAGYSPKVELNKTGDTLTISVQNEDGTVSESIKTGEPVQSNWSVTNPDSLAYILNKPNLSKVATSNSYVDLDDKPTNLNQFTNGPGYITAANVPTKLSELTGDTTHRLVTDTEKANWDAKMDGSTTHLAGDVPTSRKVNGKALTNDITLTAEDVGALGNDTVIPEVSDVYSKTSSVAMSGKAVASAIADLVGTAPATLDTLGEIADALNKDTDGSVVNSIMAAIGEKQDALAIQTVYNAKGSATKVPQITTNALGQVTEITEVNIPIPSTMKGASASASGTSGLVPTPAAGKQESFLRGDGTWVVPTNTTYSKATVDDDGLMSAADKVKLDGIAKGATAISESTVAGWGFTKNTGSYSKPTNGIPKTDLAADVQTSLGKADTALQKHQDISGKQDKLTAGANITISGNTISAKDTTYSAATTDANGLMSAADKEKLDGITTGANNYSHPTGDGNKHVPANGTSNGGKYLKATSTAGSYEWGSLTKSDITNALGYTPPTSNTTYGAATSSTLGLVKSGTDITVDSSGNVSVNDDSHNHIISNVDGLQTALDGKAASSHTHDDRYYTETEMNTKLNAKLNTSLKGAASGLAELDSNGKVPTSQLPSYVDDVIEGYLYNSKFYKESAHTTEISGETGKIYIDLSTEKTYRWSGSAFVVISETLALGETSSTAYRGDRGKTAYDHSQSTHARTDATKVEKSSTNGNIKINGTETTVYTHPSGTNPHGTTKSDVGLGNVGNFKAVSTVASQGLSDTEKSNARANIGAGTSSFSGSYNDLTNKPTIPSVGNGTITITQNGTTKGTFTTNQSGNTTIALTDNDTTYGVATQTANGLESAADKKKLDGIATGAEVNQNAFSNVTVGSTTVSADSATDTLTLVAGSNVTITPDATNDKITIAATDTNTHYASGTIVNNSTTATANTTSALTNGNVYLNHIENGAVKNSHKISGSGATTVTSDANGNIIISSTDHNNTYSVMKGATASANGTSGLVPAPSSGSQNKFLRGDGTWQTVSAGPNITYCSQATYDGTSGTSTNNILYFIS